ncbi:glycosyltransferase family 2 protein [Lactobacillus helveticus]|uniref:glycosyltransferase family 2 protein n=1 Tax=Lactobacillus helveticus TaxID=1587 RepID=UPI000932F098|nr:glycosyltransferase family 2 protein [Lactobacillus helveticus]
MIDRELISVIVTLCNKEKYIGKCLRSIRNQSYSNIEVLVINDGSKDNSVQAAKTAIANDSRFKVITKKNGGLSSARNYGIKNAKGSGLIFIDGDDYLDENFIFNLVRNQQYDLVISGFYESLNSKIIKKTCPEEMVIKESNFKKYIFNSKHYYYCVLAWNKLFKTDIVKKNDLKFKDIVMGEDAGFVFNYLKYCKNIKVISDASYCNVIIPNTLSRKPVANLWNHNLEIVDEAEKSFKLNLEDYCFLIMRSIKVTLGANCKKRLQFRTEEKRIRNSPQFHKLRFQDLKEKGNKFIYIGIKLHLSLILQFLFRIRVKQHS